MNEPVDTDAKGIETGSGKGGLISYAISNPSCNTKACLVDEDNLSTLFPKMAVRAVKNNTLAFSDSFDSATLVADGENFWNGIPYVFYSFPLSMEPGDESYADGKMTFNYKVGTDSKSTPDFVVSRCAVPVGDDVTFDYSHIFTAVNVDYSSMLSSHKITSIKLYNMNLSGKCTVGLVKDKAGKDSLAVSWSDLSSVGEIVDSDVHYAVKDGADVTGAVSKFMTIPGQEIFLEIKIDGKTFTASCGAHSAGEYVTFHINDSSYTVTQRDGICVHNYLTENNDGTFDMTFSTWVTGESVELYRSSTNSVLLLDMSASMADPMSGRTKLDVLKDACIDYVNAMHDLGVEREKEQLVSIVTFNDEVKVLCSNLDVSKEANKEQIISFINGMKIKGATHPNKGFKTIIDSGLLNSASSYYNTVVFVTDGEPSDWLEKSTGAIKYANQCKASPYYSLVYSIGIFDEKNIGEKCGKFLDRISSNFVNATTHEDGTKVKDSYYSLVNTESAVDNIFKEIQQAVVRGSADVYVDKTAYVTTFVSDVFNLPSDYVQGSEKINFYQVMQKDFNTEKKEIIWNTDTDGKEIRENINDQITYEFDSANKGILGIKGYDYCENYCGSGRNGKGYKFIMEFSGLIPNDDYAGFGDVITTGFGTGLYNEDGSPLYIYDPLKVDL